MVPNCLYLTLFLKQLSKHWILSNWNVLRVAKLIILNWLISKAEESWMNISARRPLQPSQVSAARQNPGSILSYPAPYHFLSCLVQVLHLSHNPLISLGQETFLTMNMINLQKVYLNNCSLQTVDKTAFRSLTLMIELDLSDNKVKLEAEKFKWLL